MTATPATDGALARTWSPGCPLDLGSTLGPMRRGPGDPTFRYERPGGLWRTSRTPEGPATLRLAVRPADGEVAATAWGPGAASVLDGLPELLGAGDDASGFAPTHPVLRDTWRAHPGWRVPRTGRILEALAPAVLEQKVTGREAWRAWRWLVLRYGEPAPGPVHLLPRGLAVVPDPATWARVPSWDWHRAGVDLTRSRTLVTAAGRAGRLEGLAARPPAEAAAVLRTTLVGWALVGEPVDDDTMLELLEPYRGHRYRAVRMVELAGLHPPRRGPRFEGRDFRHM